ncbi:hypothetical protein Bca101_073668 [Brassica carinata]
MGRSYSYRPSPPRRRYRSPSPVGYYKGRSRDAPTSLLVRNLRLDCRPDDFRRPFGRFGRLKDIYIPRNYYTGGRTSTRSPYGHSRSPGYSRSPNYRRNYSRSPVYRRSYSRSPYDERHRSRSVSPGDRRRSYSRSSSRSRYESRSRSQSPAYSR